MAVRVKVLSGEIKLLPTVQEVGAKLDTDLTAVKNLLDTQISNLQSDVNNKAPISHAVTDATYGAATDTEYGHVRLNTLTLPAALGESAVGNTGKAADAGHVHALPTLSELGAAPSVVGGYLAKTGDTMAGELFLPTADVLTNDNKAARQSQVYALQAGLTAYSTLMSAHIESLNNPHNVTATQLGLGNVDNTSDLNKPISIEQAAAFNLKVDVSTTINGKALSSDIILQAIDVGAATAAQGVLAASAYQKPLEGIPASDMDDTVQAELFAASTAYQKSAGGIPKSDFDLEVQTSLLKADNALPNTTTTLPGDVRSPVVSLGEPADKTLVAGSTFTVLQISPNGAAPVARAMKMPNLLLASEISDWAKQPTKPIYTYSELLNTPTTLSEYGIVDALNVNQIGVASGVAGLDTNAKIHISQLPDVVLGQLVYAGTVDTSVAVATLSNNAKVILGISDNTITLTNDTVAVTGYLSNEGNYYIASTDGVFANISFVVGDWLIATAEGWSKIDNTDAVVSVNGKVGLVTLVVEDIAGAAPSESPNLTGLPLAPTAAVGVTTAQIATTEFVGNRIANDVPVWAREDTKPIYEYDEIANTPTIPTVGTVITSDVSQGKLISEMSLGEAVVLHSLARTGKWEDVLDKPSSFIPSDHIQSVTTITGLAAVATSGSYADLSGTPEAYLLPTTDREVLGGVSLPSGTTTVKYFREDGVWEIPPDTTYDIATTLSAGLQSAEDKTKLDGIEVGANNYIHPVSHLPSIIEQDADNRFVTDAEKAVWGSKASTDLATTLTAGLQSAEDKTKLDSVAAGAQVNVKADWNEVSETSDAYILNKPSSLGHTQFFGDTEPVSPVEGDRWLNSSGIEKVYDGTTWLSIFGVYA